MRPEVLLIHRRRRARQVSVLAWLALWLVVAGANPGTARACASCGCGDSTLTALGVEKPYQNRVRLALEERFGGHSSATFPDTEDTWTLRSSLFVSYSPIARLTLTAMMPLVDTWLRTRDQAWQNLVGVGDLEVAVRGVLLRDRSFSPRHLLSGLAGLKMPTGPRISDGSAYPYPEDDQPGSGSWDPFVGLTYGWFGDKKSAVVSANYRYTTIGRRGYVHGQSVGASVGAQLQPFDVVGFGLALDFRWAAADHVDGATDVPNTGGASIALTPSIIVAPVDRWLLKLAVQVHLADWFVGAQTESTAVILSTVVDLN